MRNRIQWIINRFIHSISYGTVHHLENPNLIRILKSMTWHFFPFLKPYGSYKKFVVRKICKIAQAVWRCVNKCLFTCLYCFSWESYRSPLCFCFSTRLTSEEKGKESRESISFELGAPHYDLSMIVTRLLEKFVSNYRFTEIEIDRIWRIERLSTLKNPNDREI